MERFAPGVPVRCRSFEGVLTSRSQPASAAASAYRDTARANAFLLLGAAMDRHPAASAPADTVLLRTQAVAVRVTLLPVADERVGERPLAVNSGTLTGGPLTD